MSFYKTDITRGEQVDRLVRQFKKQINAVAITKGALREIYYKYLKEHHSDIDWELRSKQIDILIEYCYRTASQEETDGE